MKPLTVFKIMVAIMNRFLLLFGMLIISSTLQAQDFKEIDRLAQRKTARDIFSVSKLVAHFDINERPTIEQVRFIYVWLTTHIGYDHQAYKGDRRRINRHHQDILKRRQAVCFGYASLFTALCKELNIEAHVVSGYSQGTSTMDTTSLAPDHAWNVVKVDHRWHLLDATWGRAAIKNDPNYLTEPSNDYFIIAPKKFILTHLPEQPMWQLLECSVPFEVFAGGQVTIDQYLDTIGVACQDYRSLVWPWSQSAIATKSLQLAQMAYDFHPSPHQREALGHALVDYASRLSDSLEVLDDQAQVLVLEGQVLANLDRAYQLIEFYPWQRDLYCTTLLNHLIRQYRSQAALEIEQEERLPFLKKLQEMVNQALKLTLEMEDGMFKDYAQRQSQKIERLISEEISNLSDGR